ncbi:SRPBCC family protein [Roseitranquillus sediminis]|uniref:SRPBCC family protein n=1 Tax=Roseitranquillus sediminis TaxID=2809051 RepID=UPI001D0BF789|nr:SRPBCC family protein [Roseitranquillus sediminis]MBM9596149.1 SRPBCC family protein [Roseitranquillus sediminis]
MTEDIVRSIDISAPPARVWAALIDSGAFGTWFRARFDGPFEVGRRVEARMTIPEHADVAWHVTVQEIVPERRFVFTWPHADEKQRPLGDAETRVAFTLEPVPTGTRVTVTESGFDALPPEARADARRRNEGGWEWQMKNLAQHVAPAPAA